MAIVLFPNLEALRLALAGGFIPSSMAQVPVRYAIKDDAQVCVELSGPIPKSVVT